jgi:hypothetical protein
MTRVNVDPERTDESRNTGDSMSRSPAASFGVCGATRRG